MEEKRAGRTRLSAGLLFAVPVSMVVAAFLMLAAVDPAGAARYTVSECGWYVGHDASWIDTTGSKFVRSTFCQPAKGKDAFDGVHLTSETRKGSVSVGGSKFARWRWNAPDGTTITNVHGHRWQILDDGFEHRLGGVTGSGFSPFMKITATDTVRRDFKQNLAGGTTAFESRLLCARAESKRCSTAKSSLAGVRALTFTLEDPASPSASVSGEMTGDGWLNGRRSLRWSGKDRGSGLRFAETTIDGALRGRTEHGCSKVNVGGQTRGARMQPCGLSASGEHTIDTAALSDGPHQLRHCALDFAANRGCAPAVTLRTDNTAPGSPRDLEVEGGDGWRNRNGFSLTWVVPDQGQAAPVTGSRVRITGAGGHDSGVLAGSGPDAAADVTVPGPGEYRARVWLVDAAGNEREESAARATLRFDDLPPTGFLLDPPAGRPELLRAAVADAHSGILDGTISVRAAGDTGWRDLPTGLAGPAGKRRLVARLPSESLAAGKWTVRATVRDAAGNATVISRRGNGSALRLRTPLKSASSIVARLVGPRGSGAAVRVGYGAKARITGRLSAGARGLSGRRLRITELPRAGSRQRARTRTVTTRAGGRFGAWLRRGVSRRVTVTFAGTGRFSAASAGPFELRVQGGIGFRAGPRKLKTGGRVRFRGRVAARLARRPVRGSLVAIQYLERASGRWRPVLVTRTDRRGRYRAAYRFRYITGTARIRLRAVLLPSPGFPYARSVSRAVTVRVSG